MSQRRLFLPTFLLLLFASAAPAQVTTGIAVTKTCPDAFITPGATFTCNGAVQNLDPVNTVVGLVVVNTPQGSSPTAVPCTVGGNAVSTLQPNGTPGDTCVYSVLETAPACGPTITIFVDVIEASGTDSGTSSPTSGSAQGAVRIPPCTPTPNGTPTNTPVGGTTATPTPSTTPTNTRTSTPTTTPTNTPSATPTSTATATPTTTRASTPGTTPTGAPTGVATATATPTVTPVLTGTPPNPRRQPREIPFRPTVTGGVPATSFPPIALLAAALTGAWALSRR